jgi:ABC-2 type transport system ATP-binding protein
MDDLIARTSGGAVHVVSPAASVLADALGAQGVEVEQHRSDGILVHGTTASHVGELARELGVAVHELVARRKSLEQIFMELTADAVTYRAHTDPATTPQTGASDD